MWRGGGGLRVPYFVMQYLLVSFLVLRSSLVALHNPLTLYTMITHVGDFDEQQMLHFPKYFQKYSKRYFDFS